VEKDEDKKLVIEDGPKSDHWTDISREAELKRIRALGELTLELGLQQLTVGDIVIVPSPITTANRAEFKDELDLEEKNNINTHIDEDEDSFFPELSKAEQALKDEEAELKRIAESQDDPDLYNSSIP